MSDESTPDESTKFGIVGLPMKDVEGKTIGSVTGMAADGSFTARLYDGTTLEGVLRQLPGLGGLGIDDLVHDMCNKRCTGDTHFLRLGYANGETGVTDG